MAMSGGLGGRGYGRSTAASPAGTVGVGEREVLEREASVGEGDDDGRLGQREGVADALSGAIKSVDSPGSDRLQRLAMAEISFAEKELYTPKTGKALLVYHAVCCAFIVVGKHSVVGYRCRAAKLYGTAVAFPSFAGRARTLKHLDADLSLPSPVALDVLMAKQKRSLPYPPCDRCASDSVPGGADILNEAITDSLLQERYRRVLAGARPAGRGDMEDPRSSP